MSSFEIFFGLVSVKDPSFGAVGNGVANDTAAVQAAFDAAFTNTTDCHGVFFPAGNYRILGPLYLLGVVGGRIFGAGLETTTISFENPGTGNTVIPTVAVTGAVSHGGLIQLTCNTTGMSTGQTKVVTGVGGTTEANGAWIITVIDGTHLDLQGSTFVHAYTSGGKIGAVGSEITPCFMTNGMGKVTFENMLLGSNSNVNTVGVYVFSDGTTGTTATANVFRNMTIQGFTTGILAGYGGNGANCDNGTLYNVSFTLCTLAGLRCVHQNAINWQVYGGGGTDCGADSTFTSGGPTGNSGALYSAVGGSISPICGVSLSSNTWDIVSSSSSPVHVMGGSSESLHCFGLSGTTGVISGFAYRNPVSLNCIFTDVSNAGFVKIDSCIFNPGNNNGAGTICALGNNGTLVADILEIPSGGNACKITGSAGSTVYLRGTYVGGSTPLSAYTGTVAQNI